MATELDTQLRGELEEAIAKVRNQIEAQSTADHYVGSGRITKEAISELQSELSELEGALSSLK